MNIRSIIGKCKFAIKKNAPTILVVSGVAVTVASSVYACMKTPKACKVIEKAKEDLGKVEECKTTGKCAEGEYTEQDAIKDTTMIKTKAVVEVVKEYAIPLAGLATGVTMILCGNHMHRKRAIAAAGAYASLASAFEAYRTNIRKLYGDDVDKAGISGTKKVVDAETGEVHHVSPEGCASVYSDYSRLFDETNSHYKDSAVMNEFFLDSVEKLVNQKLRIQGYLFLNDVYYELGIPCTAAGQCVGWLTKENGGHDGYISLGFRNMNYESSVRFMNGYDPAVILDFNVDGPILDMLPKI